MNIIIKESLYLTKDNKDYVIQHNTKGVEKSGSIYFYDSTRTVAVGFSRDFCLSSNLFQVSRNITDAEVPISQVIKIIETMPTEGLQISDALRILADKLKSL